jgi:hypothetical protein
MCPQLVRPLKEREIACRYNSLQCSTSSVDCKEDYWGTLMHKHGVYKAVASPSVISSLHVVAILRYQIIPFVVKYLLEAAQMAQHIMQFSTQYAS